MWDDLVCPVDRGALDVGGQWLSCSRCGRGYPVLDGIPTFLGEDDSARWRRAQRTRLVRLVQEGHSGESARAGEAERRGRELTRWLRPHIRLGAASRVLQVGLDGEGELHHLRAGARYAVDPLAGGLAAAELLRQGGVRWVASPAGALPFADEWFHLVLVSERGLTEHDARRALAEAARTVRPEGLVWVCRERRPETFTRPTPRSRASALDRSNVQADLLAAAMLAGLLPVAARKDHDRQELLLRPVSLPATVALAA